MRGQSAPVASRMSTPLDRAGTPAGVAVGPPGPVAHDRPALRALELLGAEGDVPPGRGVAVLAGEVEVRGDGVLLVVEPLEQEGEGDRRRPGQPPELVVGVLVG